MRAGRIGAVLAIAIVIFLVGVRKAGACSCIEPGPPAKERDASYAVFVATVIGFAEFTFHPRGVALPGDREGYPQRCFRMRVIASWKGAGAETVLVATGQGGGDCGYEFVPGRSYLVYAGRWFESDTLSTGLCSRTRDLSRADADFAALGTPVTDHRGGRSWASLAPPTTCPVHAGVKIRTAMSWPAYATSEAPMLDYEAVAARSFPYAALDLVRDTNADERRRGRSLHDADVCPMCRRAARDWLASHGAPCDVDRWIERDAAESEGDPRPLPAHDLDDVAYRARFPNANFAFMYDDGEHDQIDTIEGRFVRRSGVGYDDAAKFALTKEEMDRIYEKMIAVRLFDVAAPHPTYVPNAPLAKRGPCAGARLFVRTDRFVRQYQWNLQNTAEPAKLVPEWGRIAQVTALIREIISARSEVKALPPIE